MNKDTKKIFNLIQDSKEYINNIFCYSDITKKKLKMVLKIFWQKNFK